MNILLQRSRSFVSRNASTILTGLGGAGVIVTTVMAIKATPKALQLIEEAKEEKGDDLTKLEVVRVAGLIYVPTILVGVSTVACIFGANVLNKRKQASLASAYALLDSTFKEYRGKFIELYGEEADFKLRSEIAKDKYTGDEISEDNDKQLFYDEFSGRYFESTMADVIKAEHEINRIIVQCCGAYLNDFYELLGIPTTDYGEYLGWASFALVEMYWDSWLPFTHEKFTFDDGLECIIISMDREPIYDPENY